MFNRTGRRRGTFVDCLAAATAVRAGARLATANPRNFDKTLLTERAGKLSRAKVELLLSGIDVILGR